MESLSRLLIVLSIYLKYEKPSLWSFLDSTYSVYYFRGYEALGPIVSAVLQIKTHLKGLCLLLDHTWSMPTQIIWDPFTAKDSDLIIIESVWRFSSWVCLKPEYM